MFKNFFRKVRATLKNSGEGIAAAAGFALPFLGNANPLAALAVKFLPNILSAQYQDNPLMSLLKNQGITTAATAGTNFLRPDVDPAAVINQGTKASSFDQNNQLAKVLNEADPAYFETC